MDPTWQTLGIILAGVCVVVGGILALRLHAFLALTLGALVVAVLTPHSALESFHVKEQSRAIAGVDFEAGTLSFSGGRQEGIRPGSLFLVIQRDPGGGLYQVIGQVVVEVINEGGNSPMAEALPSGGWSLAEIRGESGTLLPGVRLIEPTALQKAQAAAKATIGSRVASGFGKTCGEIGLVIALAALIGRCLMDSGAADRIVRTALRWTGESGAPAAFMLSGFLLGVPVFFDTVFYLMIPLGKALRVRTGRNYLVYVLTIVCGATMAHSLVPPTPGPLFAAEQLGVGLATMMLGGSIVGLAASAAGYFYTLSIGRIWDLPLRETGDVSLAQLAAAAGVDESQLPPLWLALQPIVLPVGLIAADAIVEEFFGGSPAWLAMIGDKNIALALGAVIAIYTLIVSKRQSLKELAEPLQAALSSGGIIILITAAGGAFGAVLKETGVAGLIQTLPKSSPAILCAIAFLVTMAIRTAQGSATVAMMTAVGVLGGLAKGGELGFHPVYLALAIGCGSKPIAWMNTLARYVVDPSSAPEGASLFQQNCSTCHGERVPKMEDVAAAKEMISQGGAHETMPVWSERLTQEQLDALVAYTLNAARGTSLERGQEIFAANCASCHGDFGEGGPNPTRPGDIIAPISTNEYLKTRDDFTLRSVISNGQPNFGMSPFGLSNGGPLDDSEIDAIVAYLRSLEVNPPVEQPTEIASGPISLDGAEIYASLCAQCHGPNGEGGIGPTLADPEFQTANSEEQIYNAINLGHKATSMIAWGEILTAEQIQELVKYILQFEPVGKPTATPQPATFTAVEEIFEASCNMCHGTQGGWDGTTYETVINSGDNGPAVIPGDVENSLLAQKIRGTQTIGNKMPPFSALTNDKIQLILDWIASGAPDN